MSSHTPTVSGKLARDSDPPVSQACENLVISGRHPFLLQPDPEALLTVELVDHPTRLPQDQFTALLVDSECEV